MGLSISWDTTPFSADDSCFDAFKTIAGLNIAGQVELINKSPVMIALLHAFIGRDANGNQARQLEYNDAEVNGYDIENNIGIHDVKDNDFVRVLSHELGHFYDDLVREQQQSDLHNFTDIINREEDESEATAISYIIRSQILCASGGVTDIKIANKLGINDPSDGISPLPDMDAEFGVGSYDSITSGSSLWDEVAPIAEWIWGKNLPLKRDPTDQALKSRWDKTLIEAYTNNGKEIPDFLKPDQRTFKSAEVNVDGHTFTFTENIGTDSIGADGTRTWVYEATAGGDGNDIVVGKETGGDDTLAGGGGSDVLYGGWLRTDTGKDILDAVDDGVTDTLIGGNGDDIYRIDVIGGVGDTIIEEEDGGTDTVEVTDTYKLGDNVENLKLLDTDNIDGTGNDLDNEITGNSGDNKLDGGEGADTLMGGEGNDTYLAGDGDIIKDSDGSGSVSFAVISLSGGEREEEGSSRYRGTNGETYIRSGGTLRVSKGGKTITIKGFASGKEVIDYIFDNLGKYVLLGDGADDYFRRLAA